MQDFFEEATISQPEDTETHVSTYSQDQLNEMGWLDEEIASGAITDGSQFVRHDGYDVQAYNEAIAAYSKLAQAVTNHSATLATAPALMRDVFFSMYKAVPALVDFFPTTAAGLGHISTEAPSSSDSSSRSDSNYEGATEETIAGAYSINRQILEQMMSTVEWQQLRGAGTPGDQLASAMATIGISQKVLDALDKATIDRINQLHGLEQEIDNLLTRAEALEDLAATAKGDRAAQLFEQARQARQAALEARNAAEQAAQELAATSEATEDATRRAARAGAIAAEQEIEQVQEALKAFNGGYVPNFSTGYNSGRSGEATTLTLKEKLSLATKVNKSIRLQQLAALCGRFTRIAMQVQRTRIKHPPDEVLGIRYGNDIAHLLGSQFAYLADKDLENLFFLNFAEGHLLQYHLEGSEKQGQGPIIVALDSSGSMSSPLGGGMSKEIWSKAAMLALVAIARLQKRDIAIMHFSDSNKLKVFKFGKGIAKPAELMSCADHFYSGGTAYDGWMSEALKLVDDSRFNRADVICISDGEVYISDALRAEWQSRRTKREMRCFSLLLGTEQGAQVLASISDAILTLNDLGQDNAALQTIFAI